MVKFIGETPAPCATPFNVYVNPVEFVTTKLAAPVLVPKQRTFPTRLPFTVKTGSGAIVKLSW